DGTRDLVVGEAALRTHRDGDVGATLDAIRATWMRQQSQGRERLVAQELLPRPRCVDAHQDVAAALLARLDDVTLQFLDLRLARRHDRPRRGQHAEARYAQLRELLHEELGAVAFWKRGGHAQLEGQLSLRRLDAGYLDGDVLARHFHDSSGVFVPVAVEQANGVVAPYPADRAQMVRLGAAQRDQPGSQLAVDVESFGHGCYLAEDFARRAGRRQPTSRGL